MKTVLVIDDEASIRELISTVLEAAGCRVLAASDAREGLLLAEQATPSLILLDFLMPGISGIQLLQRLKASATTASTPVVMMSGAGADETLFRALAYDADAYLMKPFSPSQLREKVDQLIRGAEARSPQSEGILARLFAAMGAGTR